MTNKAHLAVWGMLFLTLGLLLYVLVALTYPFKVLVYHKPPAVVNVNKTVNAGELLLLDLDFTRYTGTTTHIKRTLMNGLKYYLPDSEVKRPAGKYRFISGLTTLPAELPTGRYTLEYKFTNYVWLIRGVETVVVTEPFFVRGRPSASEIQQESIVKRLAMTEKKIATIVKKETFEKGMHGEKGDRGAKGEKGDKGSSWWSKKP